MLLRSIWTILLVVASVQAQSANLKTDNASDTSASTEGKPPLITRDTFKELTPSFRGRFARAFQFQYSTLEQPGTALIQNPNGTSTFVPNPERYLNKLSLTFDFNELFLPSSDWKSLISTYTKNFETNRQAVHDGTPIDLRLCGAKDGAPGKDPWWKAVHCIAGRGGLWIRLLSATKVSFSLSERQRVLSQIIVPDQPFPHGYDKVGEVDFDPKDLFISGTNWRDAIDALSGLVIARSKHSDSAPSDSLIKNCSFEYLKEMPGLQNGPRAPATGKIELPPDPDEKCITRVASMSGKERIAAILIPAFQFKRQSQFDFVRSAGVLIPAPFGESALNTYTLTWDLRRVIASTKMRTDAVAAMTQGYQRPKTPGEVSKACLTKATGVVNLIMVTTNSSRSVCQKLANDLSAEQYGLACISTDSVDRGTLIAAGDVEVTKPSTLECGW